MRMNNIRSIELVWFESSTTRRRFNDITSAVVVVVCVGTYTTIPIILLLLKPCDCFATAATIKTYYIRSFIILNRPIALIKHTNTDQPQSPTPPPPPVSSPPSQPVGGGVYISINIQYRYTVLNTTKTCWNRVYIII